MQLRFSFIILLATGCRGAHLAGPGPLVAEIKTIPPAAKMCSCLVTRKMDGGKNERILVSTFAPELAPELAERTAWMNLDGGIVELKQSRRCTMITPGDKGLYEQCAFLGKGFVVATLAVLLSRRTGGYSALGTIKISKGESKTTMDVEESCGCSA